VQYGTMPHVGLMHVALGFAFILGLPAATFVAIWPSVVNRSGGEVIGIVELACRARWLAGMALKQSAAKV
jgi:ABC-type antimicrobial peptide transport system permease subunit